MAGTIATRDSVVSTSHRIRSSVGAGRMTATSTAPSSSADWCSWKSSWTTVSGTFGRRCWKADSAEEVSSPAP
ncbi:hypothetical protein IQ63_32645 [Streptomyces acidiscabies]|uniref:Uncharacterized protein n=1 Tax=Streptomyces acidiscabies TaxID=42234 RepID=A0A0L0JTM2_9ACTN|nr:hypothetical protein IQ63_32645 [Streptomyces acidiscabies]